MTRVFVNGKGVDVDSRATALDAVRAFDSAEASQVEAGARKITDSRGLDAAPDSPVHGGAIFRTLPVRAGASHDEESF